MCHLSRRLRGRGRAQETPLRPLLPHGGQYFILFVRRSERCTSCVCVWALPLPFIVARVIVVNENSVGAFLFYVSLGLRRLPRLMCIERTSCEKRVVKVVAYRQHTVFITRSHAVFVTVGC